MKTKTSAEQGITYLYHYENFDDPTQLARILTENRIYCSNPNDFNDPWDCKPHFRKPDASDPAQYERLVRWFAMIDRKYNRSLSEAEHTRREREARTNRALVEWMIDQFNKEIVPAILAQYRVYCVSARPDIPLMWSHYARSHKGYCLEFAVKNELFCGALPVEYLDHYPELNVSDSTEDDALRVLLTKSKDWSYENEFRLIAAAPGYSYAHVPATKDNFAALPTGALKSIIFGCLMSEPDRNRIRTLVKSPGSSATLKMAHRIPDRYALEIRALP